MTKFTREQRFWLATKQLGKLSPREFLAAGWTPREFLAAGWTSGEFLAAGWTPGDFLAAGWTLGEFLAAGWTPGDFPEIPKLDAPYTAMLGDIRDKRRIHRQYTWGPDVPTSQDHLCKTSMCTAGHLVNMAGEAGWKLKKVFGFAGAARLIHEASHPGWPCQDFGTIPDEWAMAYIETMAAREASEASGENPEVN